jgi:hypothetical protein
MSLCWMHLTEIDPKGKENLYNREDLSFHFQDGVPYSLSTADTYLLTFVGGFYAPWKREREKDLIGGNAAYLGSCIGGWERRLSR